MRPCLALSALFAGAGQTLAAPPIHATIDVDTVACDPDVGGGTGNAEVPSGTDFNIVWDWETYTLPQEAVFRHSVEVAAAIDGASIHGGPRYWTQPYYVAGADFPWFMFWKYPHRALGIGESVTFTVTPILRRAVFDGVDMYPRGPIVTLTCTITGA